MKKYTALLLLLVATACSAKEWKTAMVIGLTETKVTGPMLREPKIILHYTVETADMVWFLDYSYHLAPGKESSEQHSKNNPPNVSENMETKIAVEGSHAYLLDIRGTEVKMHVKKKMKR